MRGVPDVAGDADPNTGYILYMASEGGKLIVGGTSAVAPLWSGLFSRINQSTGKNIGFFHPFLYSNNGVCNDITVGNNGTYFATIGWDKCTGWGSLKGTTILNLFNTNSPIAEFTASPLSGLSPLNVNFTDNSTNVPTSWLWDFGDTNTSTLQNPSHAYTTIGIYTVKLTATNTNGSDSIKKTNYISVVQLATPTVAFNGGPLVGPAPVTVNFTDNSTGTPTLWEWDFGDGNTSTLQNPLHTYEDAGDYTVTLTATNNFNLSGTLIKIDYVNITPSAPSTNFVGVPVTGEKPLLIQFTDESGNEPTEWLWDFGDGTISTKQNPAHTYTSNGLYDVSLIATNAFGSTPFTRLEYINVTDNIPIVDFVGCPIEGVKPLIVKFCDKSKNTPTSWAWIFGDNSTSTLKNPTHKYTKAGKYTVRLTATNDNGSSSMTKIQYIIVTKT
jgi:PKD repeat protein